MKHTDVIPIRRLFISKDKDFIIVANAIQAKKIQGMEFSAKLPNGVLNERYDNELEEINWDSIKHLLTPKEIEIKKANDQFEKMKK